MEIVSTVTACLPECLVRLVPSATRGLGGYISTRGRIYSSKKEVSRDMIAMIQQEIDLRPVAIRRWKKRQEWNLVKEQHMFNEDRLKFLGPDLATAHFIIARGGAVRFHNINKWFESPGEHKVPEDVPNMFHPDYVIEAVDASQTQVMCASFDNFGPLKEFRYLDLSKCPNIDDWALDRLVDFRKSLQYLDLSGCERVTERGLASLHKLPNLRRLKIENMPQVLHKKLTAVMLEEVLPSCVIEGVNFDSHADDDSTECNLERDMFEKYEHRLNTALENDTVNSYFSLANIKF